MTEQIVKQIKEKLNKVQNAYWLGNSYEEDKNEGWEEALQWVLEIMGEEDE